MRNALSWSLILVFLLGAGVSHSQKVLRRVRQYVLIDMNASSGLAVGGEIDVYRKNELGFFSQVGRVRVVRYQSGKCAAEIVSESIDLKISAGDFADLPLMAETPATEPADRRAERAEETTRPAATEATAAAGGLVGESEYEERAAVGDASRESEKRAAAGDAYDEPLSEEPAADSGFADAATAVYPVLRIRGKLCLIDAPESSGLSVGDEVTVWRRKSDGGDWDVGRIRIRRFHAGQCAAEILSESLGDRISRNDFVRGEIRSEMPGLGDWTIETAPAAPRPLLRKMAVVSAGTGLASVALGLMQFHFAGQAEDDYRRAATQADADRFHARSARLNRSAGLWTGAGAALILSGIAEWALAGPSGSAASQPSFSLTPSAGPGAAGLSLNLHF